MIGSGGAHVGIFASHNALNKLTCDFVQSAVRHTACMPMTIGYPDKLWGQSVVTRIRIAHLCKEAALGVSAQVNSSSHSSAYALEECVVVL